jgi:O-antigen/teichoic acid export membrane protein
MSTLKRFAGQTAIYGVTNILARTLNFLLTPIYVHVFAPHLYGVFSELFSYTSLVAAFLSLGMETTYFRFLNKEETKNKVFQNAFLTLALTSIVFGVLSLLLLPQITHYFQGATAKSLVDYSPFIIFFIGFIILDNLNVIPFARLRAENKPLKYALIKSSGILLFVLLNLFFLLLLPRLAQTPGVTGHFFYSVYKPGWIGYVFISNLISSAYTLLWLIPYLKEVKFKLDVDLFKSMIKYSWPILMANLSFIINENLDKIFLRRFLPEATSLTQLGIYSACYKLAIFLNLFIQAFRLGAEPFFFSHSQHPEARKTYARVMHYFIIVVSIIALGIVTNISWLKYWIPNKAYWAGLKVVPILVYGYVCLGIYMNLSVWYKLSDQTKFGFYISGIGAIITVVLNPILIPIIGFMGSAWTTLGAYATMMVISYAWGQKYYPIPYDLGKNIFILLFSLVLSLISFTAMKQNFWGGNFAMLIFLGVIIYTNRSEWQDWVKLLKNRKIRS